MRLAETINRYATPIKWVSAALIIVSLLLIGRAVPIDRGLELLQARIDELGVWGPLVFGSIYVVAALAFVPGSALTLAAGALFGLISGTIVVSFSSTTAAALAFLIARYLVRKRIDQQARKYPNFDAIDSAIGAQGWKIVALLRLSPAIPFSIGNYLFGLTAVRFWPYVLSSWVAMLPGTFMYVYLGFAGREGLAAAGAGETSRTWSEWALLGVGLAATIVVTVYVTTLAVRALRRVQSRDASASDRQNSLRDSDVARPPSAVSDVAQPSPAVSPASKTASPRGTIALAGLAVLLMGCVVWVNMNQARLQGLFDPPPVKLAEAYERKPGGPKFDHFNFDRLLGAHVDENGFVDYAALAKAPRELDAYIAAIADAPFDALGRDEKLALLINAYNAFTIRLILDYYDGGNLNSIKDIPSERRWEDVRWKVGGRVWSLNQIEHEQIRPRFNEPRIHFALVCAAIGCPKLRNEANRSDEIEQQLENQARYVHSHDRWFRFDRENNVVHLTKLYDWYGGDFEQVAGSVPAYAARYSPQLRQALDSGNTPQIQWLEYDWKLNDQRNQE